MSATEQTIHPLVAFKHQLDQRADEFRAALPAHMPAERFSRVIMTAVQQNPDLLRVERRSLWTSAMKCAQDGLLPDGREAALIVFKDRNRGMIAQYMPMVAGIRKKVRNSGEIATWDTAVVYEHDDFEFELGDAPFIKHCPALGERGKPVAAYSVATLKSGEKSREVMSIGEINAIRARSRASSAGPWVTDFAEMARKTVARRHSKVLPMSTDLDDVLRRDDALYDMEGARNAAKAADGGKPQSLAGRLDMLAAAPETAHDPDTGEIIEDEDSGDADLSDEAPATTAHAGAPEAERAPAGGGSSQSPPAEDADDFPGDRPTATLDPEAVAMQRGFEDFKRGAQSKAVPPEYREKGRAAEAKAWSEGWSRAFDAARSVG